jgi:hypothetical protein
MPQLYANPFCNELISFSAIPKREQVNQTAIAER